MSRVLLPAPRPTAGDTGPRARATRRGWQGPVGEPGSHPRGHAGRTARRIASSDNANKGAGDTETLAASGDVKSELGFGRGSR